MTYQGDPNRPPLSDDPDLPPLREPVADRNVSVLPIVAAAALVLVLGYLFLGPSSEQVTSPTSAPGTRIERTAPPAATPAPAPTPAPQTPAAPNN